MFRRRYGLAWALVAALGSLSGGCGKGFDPPSQIKSLRVLGVQKDKPYPAPGNKVTFTLLWADKLQRPAKVFWLDPLCFNPPGDLYQGCFQQFGGSPRPKRQEGARFTTSIDPDVINSRPPPNKGQPVYGLSYAFFAVCAGESVEVDLSQLDGVSVPLKCVDADGNSLGPDDFVVGYTALYSFDSVTVGGERMPITNNNPVIAGFAVSNSEVEADCIDGDCMPAGEPKSIEEIDCDAQPDRCVDACADDGDAKCPHIAIRPLIDAMDMDPANGGNRNVEKDTVSAVYFNRDVWEQEWINYYVDRGAVKSDVRLLNDAETGWNDDFGTEFYAPKDPGTATVWAVAHDNRGGESWVRARIGIKAR